MDKLDVFIKTFFALFIVGFLSLIVYVSLLGDNNKINFAVEQYFAELKGSYTKTCVGSGLQSSQSAEECRDYNFLIETAFLMKYDLLASDGYSLEIKKSHFWVPGFSDDTITINVAMIPKRDNAIKAFFGEKNPDYVKNFMSVKKENKLWTVQSVSLEDPSISVIFEKLRDEINLNKYIKKSKNGYILNKSEISPDNLSPVERRLFKYSMSRLSGV